MPHPPRRDPDRLFPADARVRETARALYEHVRSAPIISPHGHVPIDWLVSNQRFSDPADLLITHDHYVTRLLHASGVELAELGVGRNADPRGVWRILADQWSAFAGTASGYWLEEELSEVLGVNEPLTPESADRIFDHVDAALARDEYLPRALFRRFDIEVLATTDDPLDDLAGHAALRAVDLGGRVLPTFRPDRYIDPSSAGFAENVHRLLGATAQPTTFAGYLAALVARRQHFIAHGAVSADHGVEDPKTLELDTTEAQSLFEAVLGDVASAADRAAFHAHMLLRMAEMSVADGLVMTVHAGVKRNHSSATLADYGPDSGHDIPVRTDFVRGLHPLLERFGLERNFHLVLFTVDETTYSREVAPLAGFYPSVFIGAPWWFLDAPHAMSRFRSAVTETAGFSRGSGFIDDTRAFLSIPARHDTARRVDSAFLAGMVVEGRLTRAAAERIIVDIVTEQPKRVFKL